MNENELQIFENPEFGRVRTTIIGGEPWFVAADVCRALDLGNPTRALDRLDNDERTLISIKGASNGKPVNGVNEPGLYSLVLGSRKPEAKKFKRWCRKVVDMENNPVISAKKVAEITGRSLSSAYALLAKLNKELAEKGYITLHGKTSRQYFYERLGLNA